MSLRKVSFTLKHSELSVKILDKSCTNSWQLWSIVEVFGKRSSQHINLIFLHPKATTFHKALSQHNMSRNCSFATFHHKFSASNYLATNSSNLYERDEEKEANASFPNEPHMKGKGISDKLIRKANSKYWKCHYIKVTETKRVYI